VLAKQPKDRGYREKETVGFMCERWDNFRGVRVKVARHMLKDFEVVRLISVWLISAYPDLSPLT
jgi:hypothetical protein